MEYEVATTEVFEEWLEKQTEEVREMIATRIVRVESGLLGDHASVGDRVSELRFHSGAGYRVYYTIQGRVLVILLCGGTKGSQARDIRKAKGLAEEL